MHHIKCITMMLLSDKGKLNNTSCNTDQRKIQNEIHIQAIRMPKVTIRPKPIKFITMRFD